MGTGTRFDARRAHGLRLGRDVCAAAVTAETLHQLLTLLCPDFPFSLVRNATRITPGGWRWSPPRRSCAQRPPADPAAAAAAVPFAVLSRRLLLLFLHGDFLNAAAFEFRALDECVLSSLARPRARTTARARAGRKQARARCPEVSLPRRCTRSATAGSHGRSGWSGGSACPALACTRSALAAAPTRLPSRRRWPAPPPPARTAASRSAPSALSCSTDCRCRAQNRGRTRARPTPRPHHNACVHSTRLRRLFVCAIRRGGLGRRLGRPFELGRVGPQCRAAVRHQAHQPVRVGCAGHARFVCTRATTNMRWRQRWRHAAHSVRTHMSARPGPTDS